jgi:putative transposase
MPPAEVSINPVPADADQATFYKWRAKYGGMDVSMMSRMKELEEENRRLKKMYLEEKLKAEIVSEALEKKW